MTTKRPRRLDKSVRASYASLLDSLQDLVEPPFDAGDLLLASRDVLDLLEFEPPLLSLLIVVGVQVEIWELDGD